VVPRQSYGVGLSHQVARRLVLYADYAFHDYRDAGVHQAGPALELYAGHWLFAGRYRYAATRFAGSAAAVDDHAGSLAVGYLYGVANIVRIFGAAGGESFTQPSRDLIGRFDAHTVGLAWRHFLTPGLGVEALYAHQDRSDGGNQESYSLRVVRRW
jgi:YaiO family outer membrane protein